MRNWDSLANNDILGNDNLTLQSICPQEQDYIDAQAVAKKIGIPLLRVDFIKEYWDDVFSYFLEEYRRGRTPNPDVFCNKYIKFDAFLQYAKKQGAEYIATGHYVKSDGQYLYKAADLTKDQSYFLALLSKDQIQASLFPLGDITKVTVRQIANQLGLSVANKKDSTGICFIGERDFKHFLQNYIPAQPGNIIDVVNKEIVGRHQGVMYYTLGQRKGLGIGGIAHHQQGSWFVVGKDLDNAELFVVQGDENDWLYHDSVRVTQVNWVTNEKPTDWFECMAKFRYRQVDNPVKIRFINENEVEIHCIKKVKAITPGQICVFYHGNKCLGGGVIDQVK
jgi:tRNA-specific 2-thiouridylase